ncbi:capsular exopolysaccharide synthesis family protein [Pseudarthrobacter defluvii]|uniref:polysaccharide biosynthesis tyrosine autokinase n=1 Tax=Pseudarthrobacter defluvii TaxID=410837 RepID=UPI0027828CFE|nr:polysaccharide biosynthesis tyrosine autokinase [Pseudarthrobacter defluvii]MDQ0767983.1 capsular exopolysaccharide synthesis family protein [Pseudarthrobacter defluvii]
MDLRDYLRIFSRNWLLIVGCTLVGLLVGAGISLATKPTYTAETQLFVAIQNSGSVQELQQGNTFSQARVQSYVKAVNSPIVLQPVIDSLGLGVTADELSKSVKGTTDVNTVLINIEASDSSPVRSAAIAQGVANSLIDAIERIERPKNGGSSPFNVSVIKPAVAPSSPASPNTRLNLILGFILGLGVGLASAVLKSKLDSRIRGEADVRQITDSPVLGGIAYDADATRKPLLTQTPTQSPRAESFRQLRTNLQFANVAKGAKTVLVTSSVPGEGKSTSATNLAIAMAQAGQAVCLIDADLRRPMVSEYLGLDRTAGLTTALVGQADVRDLLQPWGDDELFILTSGQIPPNPSELLGSRVMKQLLADLEQVFDTVIIDAPPLLPVTDAAVLSQHVGGVILVVGSQKLRQQELVKSLSALEMVGSDILGIVLNRLPIKGPDAYSYSYYRNENHDSLENVQFHEPKAGAPNSGATMTDDISDSSSGEWARPPRTFPANRPRR